MLAGCFRSYAVLPLPTLPYHLRTISQLHQLRGFPAPTHPLLSVVDIGALTRVPATEITRLVAEFYLIALKRQVPFTTPYGQQTYDFDTGVLAFIAPGQVFGLEMDEQQTMKVSGWLLLIHPDFLWNTPLAQKITQYDYFHYAASEALHVSEQEEQTLAHVIHSIAQESQGNLDRFSQDVILAHLEVLLTYADRFYQRQFLTRKKRNHQLLARLETVLDAYLTSEALPLRGLPTVQYMADALHVSPAYLSGLLKAWTGQSTQHYLHDKLLAKAKVQLSTTALSVSEIAYALGFEHPQSFSKLFKAKTNLSPLAFRESFH